MRKAELGDLIKVVEAVRDEAFPHVSRDLLHAVIAAEAENPDNEDAAIRQIREAVTRALANAGGG